MYIQTKKMVAWWRHEDVLHRFVCDLIGAELFFLRRSRAGLPPLPWQAGMRLQDELGVDSLEWSLLASALANCLHMHDDELGERLLLSATLADWTACARDSLARRDSAITFRTSGSSGAPKNCTHRLDLLWQEAAYFAALFPEAKRIVSVVPCHHIYGFLFSVLVPLAAPRREIEWIDGRRMLPAELARQAATGDVIIAYPEFWAAVAARMPRFAAGVTGVTSTGPCCASVGRQLHGAGLDFLEVYGSSETAGVGWRRGTTESYALLPYWRRAPAPGMLVRDADGGEYPVQCQDTLVWHDEGHFLPAGRRDHAVQVGGVNVSPEEVAAVLRRHAGVRDAAVRLMRPDEGQRLKAYVVPLDERDAATLGAQLALWVRTVLAPASRPVAFTVGLALPSDAQGKLADWMIGDSEAAWECG